MTPALKAARERVEQQMIYDLAQLNVSRSYAADLRLILAALDEQEWRPIETAPRDGSDILLLASGMAIEARFCPGEWSDETPISPREYSGAVWSAFDDALQFLIEETSEGDFHGQVTHWRPLPAPPVEVKG
jgi:hypothetical protein